MSARQHGFSLLEGLLALALGLTLLAAASQVFVASVQSWRLQGAVAQLQDDARLALQRMAQDIRMTGMFGCLRLQPSHFENPALATAFASPVQVIQGGQGLSLIVAQLPGSGSRPAWTVLTDCRSWAQVRNGPQPGSEQTLAFAISRHTYLLRDSRLTLMRNGASQPLIDNVRDLRATLVASEEGERVDVQLTLFDPQFSIEQRHGISVALRNRRPES